LRQAAAAFIIASILFAVGPSAAIDLQDRIDRAASGDTIRIERGTFDARPQAFVDSLCGNCLVHRTPVRASSGFLIRGKDLVMIGAGPEKTILTTRAGYGIFVDRGNVTIRDLTVTGGVRDIDGNATDAAVVVRGGHALLSNLHLEDNAARAESVVVGIGGVMGREGADLDIRDCRISNNGWDGIALYRGATAVIADNVISGGRGAGIGITWDAAAIVERNRVSGYWKGIGTFGQSRAIVRNNAVFDNLGWGIIATGESFLEATQNVIVRNGNCGFAVWDSSATGIAENNIISGNGWRKEWVCPCVGIWHAGTQGRFPVRFNDLHANVAGPWRAAETPVDSLLARDPLFRGERDFRLMPGSPMVDAGDTLRTDRDGSRSDIGLTGGPGATPGLGSER
jgi:parallel beta-helix repeat protein